MLLYAQTKTSMNLALHCVLGETKVRGDCSRLTTATLKSPNVYENPGSDRQAVIELLSLTEVLLQNNPSMQCSVIIKACRSCYRPYFYFPKHDVLIRTSLDISLQSTTSDEINHEFIGSFILSLMMYHLYNMQLFKCLESEQDKCGWSSSYAASKMKFDPHIYPQSYTAKVLSQKELQNTPPAKRSCATEYSDFDY